MRSEALSPGSVIGDRFQIEKYLGGGGLGDLYRALDRSSDKEIAIRVLTPELADDEAVVETLRGQVKAASALSHKNIVGVYGMGREGGVRYIAMEFVDGQSLRQLLARKRQSGRTFSLKGAYNVLAHVCNALHHAHGTMVHALVGPGAILINRAGRVKVADFGLVRALPPHSPVVASMGDSYALSPEMALNPPTAGPPADVYTLGVVLYEMLTGQRPADPPAPMSDLVSGLPPAVEACVGRCLQPVAPERFPDVQQLKAAFYSAIEERTAASSGSGASEPAIHAATPIAEEQRPPAPGPGPASVPPPPPAPRARPSVPMAAPAPAPAAPVAIATPIAPPPPAVAPARQVSIEDLLAETDGDTHERWLVQKDRLDFGPYTTGDLKRALYKGEFTAQDVLVDQDSGARMPARQHETFQEFARHLDRHLVVKHAHQSELSQRVADRKRRTILMVLLVFGVLALAAGGVVAAWMLTRDPEVREKIVYRDKMMPGIKGLDVQWNAEPPEQIKKRKLLARKRRRPKTKGNTKAGQDVTYLGDATKEGGDELLSQKAVQEVMRSNFSKLTGCVQQEWRRNRGLRGVDIDFGVQGSGKVASVKVNGQTAGPFQACVSAQMHRIRFPKFDGALTRASFSMRLKI